MSGIFCSAAISARRSAIIAQCASLSITQGPAISTSGCVPPMRRPPISISRAVCMSDFRRLPKPLAYAGSAAFSTAFGAPRALLRGFQPRADAAVFGRFERQPALVGGADKRRKERVRRERLRFELGVELAADEPGMVGRLDDLDVGAVRPHARRHLR